MLEKMSGDVAYCYGRARECFAKAQETSNALLKAELLDLEVRWRLLAQSYQFHELTPSIVQEFAGRSLDVGRPPSAAPEQRRVSYQIQTP